MSQRRRGRPNKKKEESAEDYCFSCKDGGLLVVCEHKQCHKAYHPHCVGKDEELIETKKRWICNRHSCFICRRSSAFHCFVCPSAVCRSCIKSAEFVNIKRTKGFCNNCLRLALLVEQNVDVDSDGGKVDFKDRSTYEFLFKEYWEIINEKEGLTLEDLHSADNLLRKGQCFQNGSDSDNLVEGEEEDQDFDESMDGKGDIEPCFSMGKEPKLFSPRKHTRKGKPKKREFIGWGSKSLREFLKSIGKDSDNAISQNEVHAIITRYIYEKKLTDPEKKKKVLCDTNLQFVLGRRAVNRNKIYDLLERHFAENLEQSEEDEWSYHSDEKNDITQMTCKRQRRTSISRRTDVKEKVLETPRSLFASVTAENIKMVYLRRSLMEDLLKDSETFVDKVMGSFVRVKSDPNDYFQKNAYQLLQVTGITMSRGFDKISEEVTLNVSNMKKDFRICMLSDEDFLEEEIEDLHQRVKDGMLKRLTIVELEQKARSLHEALTKHWIKRELLRLQNLSDRANEKGWRREFLDFMERKQLLQTSSEQQRLIQEVPKITAEEIELEVEVPKVIAEETKLDVLLMDLPKDGNLVKDDSPRSILPSFSATADDTAGVEDAIYVNADMVAMPVLSVIEVNGEDTDTKATEKSAEGIEDSSNVNADVEVLPDLTVIEVNEENTDIKAAKKVEGTGAILADSEQDEIEKHPAAIQVIDLDNDDDICPDSEIWHYVDPSGCTQGPFSMSQLNKWRGYFNVKVPEFKVWKTGQGKEEAILLEDALTQMFEPSIDRNEDLS